MSRAAAAGTRSALRPDALRRADLVPNIVATLKGEAAFEQGRDYEIRIEFATKPFATLGLAAFAVGIGKPAAA